MATTENHTPRFPDITVQLTGEDGNHWAIIGRVRLALRQGGATSEEQTQFTAEATAGDYDHLLRTVMAWVDTE